MRSNRRLVGLPCRGLEGPRATCLQPAEGAGRGGGGPGRSGRLGQVGQENRGGRVGVGRGSHQGERWRGGGAVESGVGEDGKIGGSDVGNSGLPLSRIFFREKRHSFIDTQKNARLGLVLETRYTPDEANRRTPCRWQRVATSVCSYNLVLLPCSSIRRPEKVEKGPTFSFLRGE